MKNLNNEEFAYIAGIIDGDGCIHINKKKGNKERSLNFSLEVTIINTSEKLMNWLFDKIGGSLYFEKKRLSPKWKRVYRLRISRRQAGFLLEKISPYLVRKKRQAEIGLLLRSYTRKKEKGNTRRLTEGEINERHLLYQEMKKLNRRGRLLQ